MWVTNKSETGPTVKRISPNDKTRSQDQRCRVEHHWLFSRHQELSSSKHQKDVLQIPTFLMSERTEASLFGGNISTAAERPL